jgi:hypothetical protein
VQVRGIGRPGWARLACFGFAALAGLALPVAGRLAAPAPAARPCRPAGITVACVFPAGPARTWQVPYGVVRLVVTVTGGAGAHGGTGPGEDRAILSGFRLSGLSLRLSPGGTSSVAIAPSSSRPTPSRPTLTAPSPSAPSPSAPSPSALPSAAPPSVASPLVVAGGGYPVFPAATTVTDGITVTPAPAPAVSGGPASPVTAGRVSAGSVTVSYTRRRTALTAVSAVPAAGTSAAGPALLASARLTAAGFPVAGQPVTFTAGGTFLCAAVTGSGGVVGCRDGYARPLLLGWRHGITASYRGGLSYEPSASLGPVTRPR